MSETSMTTPTYIGLDEAREVLASIGVVLNERQIKRASEPDAHGKRKLPFFIDPVSGTLRIEKQKLLGIYQQCQREAATNSIFPGL